MNSIFIFTTFLALMVSASKIFASEQPTSILLDDVQPRILKKSLEEITLKAGSMTTYRRAQPIAQLRCVRGACEVPINTVHCRQDNKSHHFNWNCTSQDLPVTKQLAKIEMICEGYDHPNDEYILVGSCGVRYTIEPQHSAPLASSRGIIISAPWFRFTYDGDLLVLLLIIILCCCCCFNKDK